MFALGIFGTIAALFSWSTPVPDHTLVNIKQIIPNIVLDIKYATTDNFTGKVLYPSAECYVLKHVALALADVQKELNAKGFGLKIWDCYRPLSVQRTMWNIVKGTPQEIYIADPTGGGRHPRGTAVDLTMVYLKSGHEVEMPTGFDDFSERAWRSSTNCPYRTQVNRRQLEQVMQAHGFIPLPHEWWHFDYKDWADHEPLDINFKDLK